MPRWRGRREWLQPGAALAALELVASEDPALLPFVVEGLAASPAREMVLELVELFGVRRPAELVERAAKAAAQLDRLELLARRRWSTPRELIGPGAFPASILSRFAEVRADRWRRIGRERRPELVRVDRRLRSAAGKERAAELVREFLTDPPRGSAAGGP